MIAQPEIVWHWVTCSVCGGTIYAKNQEMRHQAVRPLCCTLVERPELFGKELPSDARIHPTSDTAKRMLCMTCGHEKKFGARPADGAEGDDPMATKKPKKGPGAPIATLGEAAKVARSEPVERRRYRLQLPCKIDESLSHAKGLELARVCRERKEFEELRAQENRDAREKAAYFDETIERLRVEVEGCVETRTVECVDRLLPTNEVQVVRLDTGEVIETRAAKPHELQESLLAPLPADGKGKRKASQTDPAPPPPAPEPPFGEEVSA